MEIARPRHQKKFLGGYRHQLTGVEYHHAAVQTLQKKRPDRGVQVFSRDTQVTTKHQHQFSHHGDHNKQEPPRTIQSDTAIKQHTVAIATTTTTVPTMLSVPV